MGRARQTIITTDSGGFITHWNEAAQKLTGYSEEVVGRSVADLLAPNDGSAAEMLRTAVEEGHCEREGWLQRPDTRETPALILRIHDVGGVAFRESASITGCKGPQTSTRDVIYPSPKRSSGFTANPTSAARSRTSSVPIGGCAPEPCVGRCSQNFA